jgi:hypothetical protein
MYVRTYARMYACTQEAESENMSKKKNEPPKKKTQVCLPRRSIHKHARTHTHTHTHTHHEFGRTFPLPPPRTLLCLSAEGLGLH